MSNIEEKKKKLRLLLKRKKLRELQAAKTSPLPQVLGNEQMTPEHEQFAQSQGELAQISNVARAATPRVPILTEGADMAAAGVRSLVEDRPYTDIRDEQRSTQGLADEQQPGIAGIGSLAGMAIPTGGLRAGIGMVAADETMKRDGDIGQTLEEAGPSLVGMAALGGAAKLAGKVGTKILGRGGSKAAQDAKVDEFINPTATQRAAPGYRERIDTLTDEVLIPAKANQAKLKREELTNILSDKKRRAGEALGEIRKTETNLSRKDLKTLLDQKRINSATEMDAVGIADYRKAAKVTLPEEYTKLSKGFEKVTADISKGEKKVQVLSTKLAKAKDGVIKVGEKSPQRTKLAIENVNRIEKEIAEEHLKIEKATEKLKRVQAQMTEIEEGKVTLDQLYKQKTNLKRKDYAGEAEGTLRDLENDLGGDALKAAKKEYGETKKLEKMARSSFGKHAVGKNSPNPHVPLGKINQAIKAVQTVLPKHKEALKLAGIKPTGKLLRNDRWSKALTEAFDRDGAKGMTGAHFILMKRDPKYNKAYNEEKKAEAEEGE